MDYKEKVIALLNSKELSKEQKEKLEDIFPEFREPEDERIKSAAIEFVIQNKSFNYYLGISKDDVVTWINRQGEQKAWTEEDKNMLKWVIGYLENKMLNTPISEERTACKNAIAWFKKLEGEQKPNPCDGCVNRKGCINCENGELRETEQKPVDEVEPKKLKFKAGDRVIGIVSGIQYYITEVCDDYYNTESGCIIMFCAQENFELYKQKPVWSEEDDIMVNDIDYALRCQITYPKSRLSCMSSWIGSLKDRVQPKPKQEWSEEDEAHLIILDSICESSEAEYYDHPESLGKKAIINAKNWLKTLKDRVQPQSQWKPSNEQMNLLEELVEDNNQRYFYTILRSLYEQLKKLKEELL